ncbi:hypothetical protein VNI00_019143 [Paramarasmius palmivorus]|uniref:Secreted protein n=1 Tax=Paramarasmius palmivorus TaxID=297713 RepID=A0AAW0APC9_9AGAR
MRMVLFFGVAVTTRILALISQQIVTDVGGFYSVWRCDELLSVLTDAIEAESRYPLCSASGTNASKVFVAVLANARSDSLGYGSAVRVCQGMALWFPLLFHTVGMEFYLIKSEEANSQRQGFVLEPRNNDQDSTLLS